MEKENKAYFSINEFAEKLNIHPNTVRNSIKQGRLSSFRIGSGKNAMYRIPASELERLILLQLDEAYKNFKEEN